MPFEPRNNGSVVSSSGKSAFGVNPRAPAKSKLSNSRRPSADPYPVRNVGRGPSLQPANVPSNAWLNGGPSTLKSALDNARGAASHAPSRAYPNYQQPSLTFEQIPVNRPPNGQPAGYNPSMAPAASQLSTNWRRRARAPSRASAFSHRGPVDEEICVRSGLSKRDFRLGDIISIPFHTPNMNPNVDPCDDRLRKTCEGPVYSKRRMLVVLWLHRQDMFCLPLYSHSGTGLRKKQHMLEEYVTVQNVGDIDFANQGVYPPVEAAMHGKPLNADSVIHLACGVKVGYEEDIGHIGRVTQRSHSNLVELWQGLSRQAAGEPW